MRAVLIGSSGAGKSTFGRRLATAAGLEHIELDALNWGPGWHNRSAAAPDEFDALIKQQILGNQWVIDGNYATAMRRALPVATHLIWLDFSRPVVMQRVIWRSFIRVIGGQEVWPGTGNREYFRRWLDKGYPIRESWNSFGRWRSHHQAIFDDANLALLQKHRLHTPAEAAVLLSRLSERLDR